MMHTRCRSNFARDLSRFFEENFEKFGELGAAVSVWQNGKPVVDLYGGFCDARREKPWTADTLVLVWSATKGIGSACVLHALQEHEIELVRTRRGFLAGICSGRQGQNHARAIAFTSVRPLRVGSTSRCARLRRSDPSAGDTKTAVDAGDRAWLSRAHVWISSGRTRAPVHRKNVVRVLAGTFCGAAPARSLDRFAGKGESTRSDDLRGKERKPPEPEQFYRDLVTPGTSHVKHLRHRTA